MVAEFNWWLLIVGVVAGGVLTWLVLADTTRREREIADEELMAEAGYADGFTMSMPDASPVFPDEQAALTEALASIDITVTYEPITGDQFVGSIIGGQWPANYFNLTAGSPFEMIGLALTQQSPFNPFKSSDPTVEELWINAPDRIYIARAGVAERVPLALTDSAVRDLVERMLHATGRRVDLSQPFVDASMPDGSRRRTFDLAIQTAHQLGLERLLSATYRLDDHHDAIAHASTAGRHWRHALNIYIGLGVPDAERVATALGIGPRARGAADTAENVVFRRRSRVATRPNAAEDRDGGR